LEDFFPVRVILKISARLPLPVFAPGPKTTPQVFVIVTLLFQELTGKHKTLNSKTNIARKKKKLDLEKP
jgi:hypothetical protein